MSAERWADLVARIRTADAAYYEANAPILSDAAYDAIVVELRALEAADPTLATPESPLARPGGSVAFSPVRHRRPMLSLANSYDPAELVRFDERARRSVGYDPARSCVSGGGARARTRLSRTRSR